MFDQTTLSKITMVILVIMLPRAEAVVVHDTTENTVAPADDPGFNNVADVNGFSGIYLGNRWMLTAAHVRTGSVTFPDNRTFEPQTGSEIRIANPDGFDLTPETDLVLFKLTEDPQLPTLSLSKETPPIGAEVLLVGNGRNRENTITHWDVERKGAKWIWTETDEPGDYSGYKTIGETAIRWGQNIIENDEPFVFDFDSNHTTTIRTSGDVISVITEFDNPLTEPFNLHQPATDYESHAVRGDSGGAMFHKNNDDEWTLSGVVVAVSLHRDQPNDILNAIFGNVTYSADLSAYREQIVSVYLNGDFNGDEILSDLDIDLLAEAAINGSEDGTFDLDQDGDLDADDRAFWVNEIKSTFFGDANLDGQFDSLDLIAVFQAGGYEDGIPGNSTWSTGDWNGDFEFDTADLIKAFQDGAYEQGPLITAVAVPETTGSAVILFAIFGLIHRRRWI